MLTTIGYFILGMAIPVALFYGSAIIVGFIEGAITGLRSRFSEKSA